MLPPKSPWKKLNISFFLLEGATPMHPRKGFRGALKFCKCSYEVSLTVANPAKVSRFHCIRLNFAISLAMDLGTALDEKLSDVKAVARFNLRVVIVTVNT